MSNLILKATLMYPQKYSESLKEDVKTGLKWVYEETKKELELNYPTHEEKEVAAYIWAWQVKCPHCGFENPLVGQWWLSRKTGRNFYLDYEKPTNPESTIQFKIIEGINPPLGNCSEGNGVCIHCGVKIENRDIIKDIKSREREILLALVVNGRKHKEYSLPSSENIEAIKNVNNIVKQNIDRWIIENQVPNDEIPEDTRGSLSARLYLNKWRQLLNPRQLLLFLTLEKNVKKYCNNNLKSLDPDYKFAVAIYLSFLLGKHIDRNCRSTVWDRTNGQISSTTGRKGVGMMWDHAEVNPFAKGSGTLSGMIDDIISGLSFAEHALKKSGNCYNNKRVRYETKSEGITYHL
jgi:adenine-specific DNA methylase